MYHEPEKKHLLTNDMSESDETHDWHHWHWFRIGLYYDVVDRRSPLSSTGWQLRGLMKEPAEPGSGWAPICLNLLGKLETGRMNREQRKAVTLSINFDHQKSAICKTFLQPTKVTLISVTPLHCKVWECADQARAETWVCVSSGLHNMEASKLFWLMCQAGSFQSCE